MTPKILILTTNIEMCVSWINSLAIGYHSQSNRLLSSRAYWTSPNITAALSSGFFCCCTVMRSLLPPAKVSGCCQSFCHPMIIEPFGPSILFFPILTSAFCDFHCNRSSKKKKKQQKHKETVATQIRMDILNYNFYISNWYRTPRPKNASPSSQNEFHRHTHTHTDQRRIRNWKRKQNAEEAFIEDIMNQWKIDTKQNTKGVSELAIRTLTEAMRIRALTHHRNNNYEQEQERYMYI